MYDAMQEFCQWPFACIYASELPLCKPKAGLDQKMLIINSRYGGYGRYVFNIEFWLLLVAGTIDSKD
jgi:hypothetical protein